MLHFIRITIDGITMNVKLTLKLDELAISAGKKYASEHNKSLSQLVEDYFIMLDSAGTTVVEQVPISQKLSSLVGIGAGPLDEDDYRTHLLRKHE